MNDVVRVEHGLVATRIERVGKMNPHTFQIHIACRLLMIWTIN